MRVVENQRIEQSDSMTDCGRGYAIREGDKDHARESKGTIEIEIEERKAKVKEAQKEREQEERSMERSARTRRRGVIGKSTRKKENCDKT